MKTALVLAGGGAKGAYQSGCVSALEKLGFSFNIVTGTSIGALNGLLITQKDTQALYSLWDTITIKDIFKDPINFDFSIESMLSQANLIIPFFKSYIDEKGSDITPLKNTIHKLYDGDKAYPSDIDYGAVTVKYPSLEPLEITKKKMSPDTMVEYAIASASCFPAFPVHYIGKQGYIDGGYYDNLPISLALEMGADKIITLELKTEAIHPYFLNRPNITRIRPSRDLGGFLDFSRDILDERIKQGYLDTMKVFNKLKGYRYTFKNDKIPMQQQNSFYYLLLRLENSLHTRANNAFIKNTNAPITKFLLAMTHKDYLNIEDYVLLALETSLDMYHYSYDNVYDYQSTTNKIYQQFLKGYSKNKNLRGSINKYSELFKEFSSKEITYYLYKDLLHDQKIDMHFISSLFTKELVVAMYFYTLTKTK